MNYAVILQGKGKLNIAPIAAICRYTDLRIHEAKRLVEFCRHAPVVVKSNTNRIEARNLTKALSEAGASASVLHH